MEVIGLVLNEKRCAALSIVSFTLCIKPFPPCSWSSDPAMVTGILGEQYTCKK